MSEINLQSEVNNVENANDNVITEAEFAILEKEIKKQSRKVYFKTSRITLLFGALLLGIGVLAFSLFEESLMLTGIALLSVPILLVVFIIVIVKIYKPYSKNYKEFKQKLNENPEIKKTYRQKNMKSFLIRLIIVIILINDKRQQYRHHQNSLFKDRKSGFTDIHIKRQSLANPI